MSGKQTHFFMLTALGSAVLGILLGAALSFGDNGKEDLAAAESGRKEAQADGIGAETIGAIGPARHFFKSRTEINEPAERNERQAQSVPPPAAVADRAPPRAKQSAETLPDFEPMSGAQLEGKPAVSAKSAAPGSSAAPPHMAGGQEGQGSNMALLPAEPRGVLNGYKGYRHHRPGYKSGGDGWWYPRAAFTKNISAQNLPQKPKQATKHAGQNSGKYEARTAETKQNTAKQQMRKPTFTKAALLRRHIAWCMTHHPSYNLSDNSYRRSFGAKRRCVSPYWRK